jgi:creatinine amidohydrolase
MKTLLAELRPPELQERIAQVPLILVPIGTIEWHADHLPVGVDGLLSTAICRELAERTGCLVAPPIWFGVCRDLPPEAGYYGTIATISEQTLESLVADLLVGLARLGFRRAVLVSGHFEMEHYGAIQRGIERAAGAIQAQFMMEGNLVEDKVEEHASVEDTWPFAGDHAAEFETSLMQHRYPDLVDMASAPQTIELPMEGIPPYIRKRYPRRASAEYGALLHDEIVRAGERSITGWLAELR